MIIFYDLLQLLKKDFLKDVNYVIYLYRINVMLGLFDVLFFLFCFILVLMKILFKLGNCYFFYNLQLVGWFFYLILVELEI